MDPLGVWVAVRDSGCLGVRRAADLCFDFECRVYCSSFDSPMYVPPHTKEVSSLSSMIPI